MTLDIGISALSFYVPHYTLDLSHLAQAYDLPDEVFRRSLGQERMSYPPPCEDVVSMSINAALQLKERGVNL